MINNLVKKIFFSFFLKSGALNILASIIGIVSLQIFVLPFIAAQYTSDFPDILILLGYSNILCGIVSGAASNLIIRDSTIKSKEEDYTSWALFFSSAIVMASIIFVFFISNISFYEAVYILILSLKTFLMAFPYKSLNFKYLLIANLINLLVSSMLILASYLELLNIENPFVYIVVPELFSTLLLIYVYKKFFRFLSLHRIYLYTIKEFKGYIIMMILMVSTVGLKYIDRVIIPLFLEENYLAILYAGSILGMLIMFPLGAISNMIFSYLSNKKVFKKTKGLFQISVAILITLLASSVFIYNVTPLIVEIFYREYSKEITLYLPLISIIQPLILLDILLRGLTMIYIKDVLKIVIDISTIIGIITLSTVLIGDLQLKGYIIALIITYLFKNCIQVFFVFKFLNQQYYASER